MSKQLVCFGDFVEELIRQDAAGTIRFLDGEIGKLQDGAEKREELHGALLDARTVSPPIAALRAELALQNRDSIFLAPFRPSGLEFLLSTVEDRSARAEDRVRAVLVLGIFGDRTVLERLQAVCEDATPYASPSPLPESHDTVGEDVRRAVEKIRTRLAERDVGSEPH